MVLWYSKYSLAKAITIFKHFHLAPGKAHVVDGEHPQRGEGGRQEEGVGREVAEERCIVTVRGGRARDEQDAWSFHNVRITNTPSIHH